MPEIEDIRAVALQWIKKAENDLKNAVHTLKLGEDCPTDTVSFHAQQCVEKYLKGLLSFRGIDFPKTHNITELVALLPASTPVGLAPTSRQGEGLRGSEASESCGGNHVTSPREG